MDAEKAEAEIRAIAKDGDPDRYAAALFAPRDARDNLLALIAFNAELARVAPLVKEPQLGEIRLQWWREALAASFAGESAGHPVADAVARAAKSCVLRQEDLARLIDARHFDVSVKIMPDEGALEQYLEGAAGTMFGLSARMANPSGDAERIGAAARLAGKAYGLTGLMRSLPFHLAGGRIDLPADALRRHGIATHDLLAGRMSQGLAVLLREWREQAGEALAAAMREIALLPGAARPAFLPLALAEPYLKALAKERDALRTIVTINPLYRLWRLGTSSLRKTS